MILDCDYFLLLQKCNLWFLKVKIWSCCIDCLIKTSSTNLDCTFRKFYAVAKWTPISACRLVEYLFNHHLMLFKKIDVVIGLQAWYCSLCAIYLLCVLQRVEKWEYEGLCTNKKWWSIERYFWFKSYLKKDYKIPLIDFLVTKISKCKLKIQIMSTDCFHSRVHLHCLFRKGKETQNLFALV